MFNIKKPQKLFCAFVLALTAVLACAVFFTKTTRKTPISVIKFSTWGSQSEMAVLRPILKEFEIKNPGIKVELLHVPQNYFQKLHLLFASNTAPDVVFTNNFYSLKYIKANLFEDLTPFFQEELKSKVFFEKAVRSSSFDGRLYVVPRDVSVVVVYYNKEIFDKNKIPYPNADWTLKDFLKTAKALTSKGVWGTGFEKDAVFWLPFLFSEGGAILDDSGQKIILSSPESKKALQFYADLANKEGAAPLFSQSSGLTMAQLFLQKRAAMHISGRWLVPKYREAADFDWDIVTFPNGSKGSIAPVDSSGYAMSAKSAHKKEALKLIKFLSSKESIALMSKSGLIVPARKDIAKSDVFLEPKKPPHNSKAFLDAVEQGKVTPVNENYQKILDNLNQILEPVFLGKASVEQITDKILREDSNNP